MILLESLLEFFFHLMNDKNIDNQSESIQPEHLGPVSQKGLRPGVTTLGPGGPVSCRV